MDHYQVNIRWSDADRAFIASIPELPGCMTDGATREEALQELQVVAQEWIETARSMGRKIPEPQRAQESVAV